MSCREAPVPPLGIGQQAIVTQGPSTPGDASHVCWKFYKARIIWQNLRHFRKTTCYCNEAEAAMHLRFGRGADTAA